MSRLDGLRTLLTGAVAELPVAELPELIGVIETAKAAAWVRLTVPALTVVDTTMLTAKQVGIAVNVPESQVLALARQHRLPCLHVGRYVRFSLVEVRQALADSSGSKTAALQPRKKRSNGAASLGAATAVLPPPGVGKAGVKHAD